MGFGFCWNWIVCSQLVAGALSPCALLYVLKSFSGSGKDFLFWRKTYDIIKNRTLNLA